MLAKILTEAGEAVMAQAMVYKAVVQTVLVCGSEIWVAMRVMLAVLEGFFHQAVRQMVEKTDRRVRTRGWECPPV